MDKTCLIITTIQSSDNPVLKAYAKACTEKKISFIIAGDISSPKNFNLPGCEYLDIDTQLSLPFKLVALLPHKTYAKKNIAYLQAIRQGHSVIIETDDDNLPEENFWQERNAVVNGNKASGAEWINVYRFFSERFIWPRGFSLQHIKEQASVLDSGNNGFFAPVQQALVNENPDVDAVFRLGFELPFYFDKREPVILNSGSVCPFNSQNTTWFREAFPLLYIPSHCSFRMCDIWRSFVAQRILWANNWHLSFHQPDMVQKRNEHNLLKDFEDEVSGYLNNYTIVEYLKNLELKSGAEYIPENLLKCYKLLVEKSFIGKEELPLLEAWLNDLSQISPISV